MFEAGRFTSPGIFLKNEYLKSEKNFFLNSFASVALQSTRAACDGDQKEEAFKASDYCTGRTSIFKVTFKLRRIT